MVLDFSTSTNSIYKHSLLWKTKLMTYDKNFPTGVAVIGWANKLDRFLTGHSPLLIPSFSWTSLVDTNLKTLNLGRKIGNLVLAFAVSL
ncbi:hypothetical protein TNCT_570961 [Trichonephila clavata]|uniref:Uncharacterized protein n=1 Tax=Trichonephila clavata TaxID=2740835 RepID=A0A8X6HSL7_TRICU|nr:hypothetical protein TNCT_570961 [Trichonephila clavata]